jgi:methionyl-tRNA synthetase
MDTKDTDRDAPGSDPKPTAGAAPEAPAEPRVSIARFMEIQLRVAVVLEAERVAGTDKLMKLQLEVGPERRQIVAGIAQAYEPDELVGKRIVIVANLEPARIRGVESQGMLLAADLDGKPIVATFDRAVPSGTRVR